MKPLLIAFTFLASVVAQQSFAQTNEVSPVILKAFNLTYSNVSNVKWSKVNDLYKAEFRLNDQEASTFYNADGSIVASSRFITPAQLPMLLQTKLDKNKDYKVTGLFEVANAEGSHYYAVIEDAKTIITLQSVENQDWITHTRKRR